ncbi:MAG TPA: hypothetical protein VIR57_18005 [Chloroflexota bacterium]|jgi:hypothetical protein
MTYELWEAESGNIIAGFTTKPDALALVREQIDAAGSDSVATWFLGCEDDEGESTMIAKGAQLAELARRTPSAAS